MGVGLVLVAFAQLATPAVSAPVRFELANGLRVWVQEDHRRPVALVQITYKAGSLHEYAGATGIAHYVEHMAYRATRNVRNEDAYGYIDRIGGRFTGGTWPDVTRYTETVPSWALESALRVTAERMCCLVFDSLEFERERSNVVTEASGFADTDAINVFLDAMMATSFEVHPYRYGSNTWARDNLVLTRDDAIRWYTKYYGPNNAVLVVVGDVTVDAARRMIERHFAHIPRAPASGEIAAREPPQVLEKRVILRYPGSRRRLVVLYRSPPASDPSFPALVVLDRHLRRTLPGLARAAGIQRISLTTSDSATPYPFVFRIAAEGDSTMDPAAVLRVIDAELERIAASGLTADEMAAARQAPADLPRRAPERQSDAMPPRRSSLIAVADTLSEREVFDWEVSPDLRTRILSEAGQLPFEEARRYAQQWLAPERRTVGFLLTDRTAIFRETRPAIPPLTVPPAARARPDPVPSRALEPLAPVGIRTTREVLPNGVIIRTARSPVSSGEVHVRVAFAASADSAALARRLENEPTLRGPNVRVSWSAQGRPRATDSAHARALRAIVGGRDTALSPGRRLAIGVVAAAGGEAVVGAVRRIASRLPQRSRAVQTSTDGTALRSDEERIVVAGARQVDVAAALPGVRRDHPDRRALELLNYIVGVPSYGGRLGWALTKSGLTYSSAATTTFGDESGSIVFTTRCDSPNTDATVQAIREVIEGVGEQGVEEWELREAQAFMLGRMLLYGAREDSDPRVIVASLTDSEFSNVDLLDLPGFSRAYLAVTLDQLNRVAKRYYRRELLKVVAMGALPAARTQIFPSGTFRRLFETSAAK